LFLHISGTTATTPPAATTPPVATTPPAATSTALPPASSSAIPTTTAPPAADPYNQSWYPGIYNTMVQQNLVQQANISAQLMAEFNPINIRDNLRWITKNLHVAGTPENAAVMHQLADQYKSYGLDVKMQVKSHVQCARKRANRMSIALDILLVPNQQYCARSDGEPSVMNHDDLIN
jgi:hypothetical protein